MFGRGFLLFFLNNAVFLPKSKTSINGVVFSSSCERRCYFVLERFVFSLLFHIQLITKLFVRFCCLLETLPDFSFFKPQFLHDLSQRFVVSLEHFQVLLCCLHFHLQTCFFFIKIEVLVSYFIFQLEYFGLVLFDDDLTLFHRPFEDRCLL